MPLPILMIIPIYWVKKNIFYETLNTNAHTHFGQFIVKPAHHITQVFLIKLYFVHEVYTNPISMEHNHQRDKRKIK